MKIFVLPAYGVGGTSWRQRWNKGLIPGVNEEQPSSDTVSIICSRDQPENPFQKLRRYGARAVLGFDFLQAWRNRAGILNADVVWAQTESQTFAVLLLLKLLRPQRRPKTIGQAIRLIDRWDRLPALRRMLARWLLKQLDILTVHSVLNREAARVLFPALRVEQVRFGIRADEMSPARETCKGKTLTVLAIGSDEDCDWKTLCEAAKSLPHIRFLLASHTHAAHLAAKQAHNVELVRARDDDSLVKLYDQSDMVIVPFLPDKQTSGLTIIQEALIRGVPVIAPDCGGLSDYFDDRCLISFPPQKPEALVSAIRTIQTDPLAAQVRTEHGQQRMRDCINAEAGAGQLVSLSRELTGLSDPMPVLPDQPTVIVGIATSGRAAILKALLSDIGSQTVRPAAVVVCYRNPADIDGISPDLLPGIRLVLLQGSRGLPAQRNVILDHSDNGDIVLFFDDDFFPQADYIEAIIRTFRQDSHILGMTGNVLADGAQGPGYSVEYARDRLEQVLPDPAAGITDAFNTYGCNMAFRLDAIRRLDLRFDEKLPLYAWYEDIDFSRRLLPHGRIVRADAAAGVHLGSKSGKTSGVRLGYSQIANPVYMARKGTYPWERALRSAGRHTLINLVRSFHPESWIDRRGRRNGNWRAWRDLVLGRLDPERINCI